VAWVIGILLVAALGLTQWLQGGHHFPVLAWPASMAAVAAVFIACAGSLRNVATPRAVWALLLIGLLAGWGWWRWIETGSPSAGFLPVVNLSTGFLVCGAVLLGMREPAPRLLLVFGLLLLAILQMLQVASWRIQNQGFMELWLVEQLRLWYPETNPRLSGFYINRNHLAWVLNVAALFAASLCVWARIPAYAKFLCGWLTGIFAIGTLLALSRGGALGLVSGLLAFLLLSLLLTARSRGKRRTGLLVLLAVLSTGVLTATGYLAATDYLVQDRLERVGEDIYREQTWLSGVRQFQYAPLIGTAPGSATDYARIYRPAGLRANEAMHLHNDWLQLAGEGGWIALSLAILALGMFFGLGISGADARLRARPPEGFPQSTEAALAIGGMSALVAMSVHSFFDFNLQLTANSLLAFCVLGIVGASGHAQLLQPTKLRSLAAASVSAIMIFCAALFFVQSKPYFEAELLRTRVLNALLRNEFFPLAVLPQSIFQLPKGADTAALAVADFWNQKFNEALSRRDLPEANNALDRALRFYRFAAAAAPLDRYPQLRLAAATGQAGEISIAYRTATSALNVDPLGAIVFEYIGGISEMAGDWQQARRAYLITQTVFRTSPFLHARRRFLDAAAKEGSIPPPGPLTILPLPRSLPENGQ
jgi:O-antigen ligase